MATIKTIWNRLSETKKNRLVSIMVAQKADPTAIQREDSFKWWLYGQVDFSKTREGFDYWAGFINRHIYRIESLDLECQILANINHLK